MPLSRPAEPAGAAAMLSIGVMAASAVVSAVVAVCAGLVSRSVWRTSAVTVPWGLALSLAGSVSLVVIARTLSGRDLGFVAAGGWLVGIGVVLFWNPGGDYLFANDGLGLSFLLGGAGAVIVVAGWGGGRR